MSISIYQATVPVCIRALTNLDNILRKGEAWAKEKKVNESVMLNSRLALDMLPLVQQVQIASDNAKGAGARLAGIENPKFEDNEQSFAELYGRLHKTVAFLGDIRPEQMNDAADKTVVLNLPGQELKFRGVDYLTGFVLPNLAFHVTTAYNILRHYGVELGKRDYLGDIPLL